MTVLLREELPSPSPALGGPKLQEPQHSVRYWPLAQSSAGPGSFLNPREEAGRRREKEQKEAGQGVPLLCPRRTSRKDERLTGQSSRRERDCLVERRMGPCEDLGTGMMGSGRWRWLFSAKETCVSVPGEIQPSPKLGDGNPLTLAITTGFTSKVQGCRVASSALLVPGPLSPESPAERRADPWNVCCSLREAAVPRQCPGRPQAARAGAH